MNKHVFSLIAVLIGMAFLASCQQSGTTATTNTGAASTGSSTRRNPPKTQGSASEAPCRFPRDLSLLGRRDKSRSSRLSDTFQQLMIDQPDASAGHKWITFLRRYTQVSAKHLIVRRPNGCDIRTRWYGKIHLLVSCVGLVRSVRAKDNNRESARGEERD